MELSAHKRPWKRQQRKGGSRRRGSKIACSAGMFFGYELFLTRFREAPRMPHCLFIVYNYRVGSGHEGPHASCHNVPNFNAPEQLHTIIAILG